MDETTGVTIAQVTITRFIDADSNELIDRVIAEDGDGDELGIAEALGMLELAKHTLLTWHINGDDE